MSNRIKLTNDNYLDSTNIVHEDNLLSDVLNDSSLNFEKTTNGWCLKLNSGFMIQVKAVRFAKANSDFAQDGNLYYTTCNMGNWDTNFETYLYGHYAIGKIEGQRLILPSGNYNDYPQTKQSCGRCKIALNWQGGATFTLLAIGFGFWK